MEKISGVKERADAIVRSGNDFYMYFGFWKDDEEAEEGYSYRHKFEHRPSPLEIKEQVLAAIEMDTRERITSGLTHEGYKINLTVENQLNYSMFKSMGRYPVVIKVEDAEGNDVALSMTKEEYSSFYSSVQNHIKECLQSCWDMKTNLDLSCYTL